MSFEGDPPDEPFDDEGLMLPGPVEESPAPEEPVLTPKERTEFVQAIQLGRAYKDVMVLGHKVSLRTLTNREELELGVLLKPYEGTKGFVKAFAMACVAAAVERIDDRPVFTPITEDDKQNLVARKFEKILDYYSVFTDQIYVEFSKFEQETNASLLEKLGKSQS